MSASRLADQLLDLYFKSVGRGASFLLNLPPDRRGQIHPTDARNLIEFNRRIEQIFAHNLALAATDVVGPMRGGDGRFSPRNLVDGDPESYWATDDAVTTPERGAGVSRAGALQRDRPARASAAGAAGVGVRGGCAGSMGNGRRSAGGHPSAHDDCCALPTLRRRACASGSPTRRSARRSQSWGCGMSGSYDSESADDRIAPDSTILGFVVNSSRQ